ncbi:MAG TPA: hypothetical protein VJ999_14435 [Candidatus Sulfotelmatobacter sp.]|nr:hypothetical protein [Candidatus Sulfotelmatobacter sp.]
MKRAIFVLLILGILGSSALARKPKPKEEITPEQAQRDLYALQFAAEIEHDGWVTDEASAMSSDCGYRCRYYGNHDCLRLAWDGGTVEAVDRFLRGEIDPRGPLLKKLGFVEVDILGLDPSRSYPYGIVRYIFK